MGMDGRTKPWRRHRALHPAPCVCWEKGSSVKCVRRTGRDVGRRKGERERERKTKWKMPVNPHTYACIYVSIYGCGDSCVCVWLRAWGWHRKSRRGHWNLSLSAPSSLMRNKLVCLYKTYSSVCLFLLSQNSDFKTMGFGNSLLILKKKEGITLSVVALVPS